MSPGSLSTYLQNLQREFATGHAQEHSYRPALKSLFEALSHLKVINEPKGSAHGRPDFIFLKGDTPIAYVEAKDLHVNLEKIEKSEQMARYFGYANLILTNGLEFRFYKNGQRQGEPIVVAVKAEQQIDPQPQHFDLFVRTFQDFLAKPIDTIRSAEHLAKIMGGKAARLRDNIADMLQPDYAGTRGTEIEKIRDVLKSKLIHDLTNQQFADLYAQTLVYGLFVARYHDDTPETFTRAEARERIPASNLLLQQFFDHIAGVNFEKKLAFIVDELCDVFLHADVHALVHGLYQKDGDTHDPIIHFYEDFLREYNPKLRTERGVFYTPLPVVRYIVRSVDALLKEHFGLSEGLADRATIEWEHTVQGKKAKQMIDRVQILDPAVGTGTFLNEVMRNIHERFQGQEGSWPRYVQEHLIGRLNGFEIMMASYTIAHLKLSMTLAETGVTDLSKRLRVFLTNSLEEAPEKDDSLFQFIGFQEAITEEALAAAEVKRDLPIMVVLGNPPYSVSSQNASIEIGPDGKKRKTWIGALLDDYKKDLNEKKLNLDDDYIKFIRFSHYLIEKNGQGVVAMITNNSFLDGLTHRRMRKSLLETFDQIYVLNLHGNSKRKEKAPDGGKDENVFDIQQGVGIILLVRTTLAGKKKLGEVHHFDLYGTREEKYAWLDAHDLSSTNWQELNASEPTCFFVPKDFGFKEEYTAYVSVLELFVESGPTIESQRDDVTIHFDSESLAIVLSDFIHLSANEIGNKYSVSDGRDWKIDTATKDLIPDYRSKIRPILYRPFDQRFTYYSGNTKGFIAYPRHQIMKQMVTGANLGLLCLRQSRKGDSDNFFVTQSIAPKDVISSLDRATILPLYLYPDSAIVSGEKRTANLNTEHLSPALKKLHLEWIPDGLGDGKKTCGPEDVFDYIYAVLHCATYRSRYKEFLKIDFPRVPFTSNSELFWKLVELGRDIRALHLLESPLLQQLRTSYPVSGSDMVEKIRFEGVEKGKVWINSTQYFGDVPKIVWEFFIGGYQPAQKWLKDRKGRMLSSDDLYQYQRVVVALSETKRLMAEIDEAIEGSGGWPVK